MKDPIVRLITFGGGSANFRESAHRLIAQSKDFGSITERKAYTDADLPPAYYELFSGLTGFGFYSWKPYLIYSELLQMETNDILVYIDAGCELNKLGTVRFDDYLSYTSKNGVLLFEQQHHNRLWTKNHPMLLGYPEHYFRNQLVATVMFLKNTEQTQEFVKAWLDLCSYENGTLLKPPGENEPQPPGFKNHRCDQSCLSICAYQHNMITMPDESWFEDWSYARNYPILAIRNRTGTSVLKKKLKIRVFKRIKQILTRLKTISF